jgi:hypothetical protein
MFSVKGLGTRLANRCKKIIHVCPSTDIETRYETIALAMEATGRCEQTIRSYIASSSQGWRWDREDLSGEAWYNVVARGRGGRDYGQFEVSSLGRIRTTGGKSTFGTITAHGVLMFKGVQVSNVICTAFHGPPCEDGLFVVHLNKNMQDNRPENLRWSSRNGKYVPPMAWATPLTDAGDIALAGEDLLRRISGKEKETFIQSLPFLIPIKDLETVLEIYVRRLDKVDKQAFMRLFKLDPDMSALKTVHNVMKVAIGVRVARQYRQKEKAGFHIAKFDIPERK